MQGVRHRLAARARRPARVHATLPGPRPDYTPDYYAAFARDADGNKLEAVHFTRA